MQITALLLLHAQMFRHETRGANFFVEFLEVGGARHFESAREVLLSHIHGILFVFDVSNRNSLRSFFSLLVTLFLRRYHLRIPCLPATNI